MKMADQLNKMNEYHEASKRLVREKKTEFAKKQLAKKLEAHNAYKKFETQHDNCKQLLDKMSQSHSDAEYLNALKAGSEGLNFMIKSEASLQNVDQILANVEQSIDAADDINSSVSQPLLGTPAATITDDDVADELAELELAMSRERQASPAAVSQPTVKVPQQVRQPVQQPKQQVQQQQQQQQPQLIPVKLQQQQQQVATGVVLTHRKNIVPLVANYKEDDDDEDVVMNVSQRSLNASMSRLTVYSSPEKTPASPMQLEEEEDDDNQIKQRKPIAM